MFDIAFTVEILVFHEFFWVINNIGLDHSKWRSETYRCWQRPHCFLYALQKYMYMYTHIYFDCVNQESWLDIHVYMLYHIKIVLRLSVPLEPSQDFLEKKQNKKIIFEKFQFKQNIRRTDRRSLSAGNVSKWVAKMLNMESLIVYCIKWSPAKGAFPIKRKSLRLVLLYILEVQLMNKVHNILNNLLL